MNTQIGSKGVKRCQNGSKGVEKGQSSMYLEFLAYLTAMAMAGGRVFLDKTSHGLLGESSLFDT